RSDVPLVGLGLMSLNTTFFVWGTTMRGYGLGSALIVLIFGCFANLLLAPNPQRSIITMLVCFLGVQVLLYNSILLIALSASAVVICGFQRRSKQALVIFAISGVAILSLLPYVPAYLRARDWNILVRGAPTSYSLWKHFEVALGNPGYSIPAVWYAIAVGLAGVFIFRIYKARSAKSDPQQLLIWFAICVCVLTVSARAAAHDLVVVVPWQFGIPFHRYYRGTAPWVTIPNISEHQIHRYDLIKAKMISAHPIDDLTEAVRTTLTSGNRIWFVGGLNLPRPEEGPMILPPAPASRFKWDNRAYTASWWQQLSVFAVVHANRVDSITLPQPEPGQINELEQTSLTVVEGWH